MKRIIRYFQQKKRESQVKKAELDRLKIDPDDLNIVHVPNPLLKTVCPLTDINEDSVLNNLIIKRMAVLMLGYDGKRTRWLGVGLAAPQIGILKRFFVMTPSKTFRENNIWYCFNPLITNQGRDTETVDEGCLSCDPSSFKPVTRWRVIEVQYYDLNRQLVRKTLKGWEAKIFQHEFDHLNGVLCINKK